MLRCLFFSLTARSHGDCYKPVSTVVYTKRLLIYLRNQPLLVRQITMSVEQNLIKSFFLLLVSYMKMSLQRNTPVT